MSFLVNLLSNLFTGVASTGTNYTCTFAFDEPECPQELL